MDAKRQDLKKLAIQGYVDINPELVDELMDDTVQRLLDDFSKKEEQHEVYAATLTSVGAIAETFGVQGVTQLTIDIAKNRPILGNIVSACSMINKKNILHCLRVLEVSWVTAHKNITLKKKIMVETITITKNPKRQAAGRLNVQKRTVNPVKVNGYFKILVPTILLTGVVGVGVILGRRMINKRQKVVESEDEEEGMSSVKQRMKNRKQ